MTSKSGGHDERNRGHQDHEALKGRALSASRSKPKKLAVLRKIVKQKVIVILLFLPKRPQMEDVEKIVR